MYLQVVKLCGPHFSHQKKQNGLAPRWGPQKTTIYKWIFMQKVLPIYLHPWFFIGFAKGCLIKLGTRAPPPLPGTSQVIIGQVLTAGCGQNPARQSALKAGLPETCPAMTINKVAVMVVVDGGWRGEKKNGLEFITYINRISWDLCIYVIYYYYYEWLIFYGKLNVCRSFF